MKMTKEQKQIELSNDLTVWLKEDWVLTTVERGVKKSGWRGNPVQLTLRWAFEEWFRWIEKKFLIAGMTIRWTGQKTVSFDQEAADRLEILVKHQCKVYVSQESGVDEW
jgi:hypothetical protein